MDIEKSNEQLWHRLLSEPRRAFEAFQTFLSLPSGGRTVVEAYRCHVDNPRATRVSDTWTGWSRDFAWRERAAAYDAHLDRIRERSIEKAIEEEAERQAREVERTRHRYREMMTMAYVQATEWLENAQPSDFRAQDVLKIIGLHLDYVKAFHAERESTGEDDWTEEDEAAGELIVKEIDAMTDLERPDGEEEEGEDSDNTESDLE